MANSKKFVVKNGLETQNIQFVEADGTESIILTVLDDGSISFSGSSGQLFSIVDSLTGSIFSVNDISGIPSIEVFDDGKVILAETTGNVGIGILAPTEKLHVDGNIAVTGTVDGVDIAALNTTVSGKVSKAGDTMSGQLHIQVGDNVYGLSSAVSLRLGLDTADKAGAIRLDGTTDGAYGLIQATTSNLHIDTVGGSTYINYYDGDTVMFGNGASGVVAVMGPDGDLWKGSSDNSGSVYWHAGNDGASSGLDADLLDGNHASAFALDNAVVKLTGDQTIAGNKTFSNNVIITGELTVNGATTNINTTNLVVEDKNIILGDVSTPSDITADGGGITLKGASDKTITWVDSTDSWTFNQTIRHEGLNPSTGTNVDQLKSTTFTSALTTGWTDVTGVSGTYLATGSYIVQIESNGEYYTGDMSWFSGSTTSTVADEIELHRAGPAASAARIYARVVRVSGSTLKLQVSASTTLSSHTMTFKFRRTI